MFYALSLNKMHWKKVTLITMREGQKYCRRSATGGDTGGRPKQAKANRSDIAARPDSIAHDGVRGRPPPV
jgi:hypothetical protein